MRHCVKRLRVFAEKLERVFLQSVGSLRLLVDDVKESDSGDCANDDGDGLDRIRTALHGTCRFFDRRTASRRARAI